MFVRYLTGRSAGQIDEMKYADAAVLIEDGRAEAVDFDNPAPENPMKPTRTIIVTAAASDLARIIAAAGGKGKKRKA